jgi:hypothetical protein
MASVLLEKEAFTGVETTGQFGLPSVALTNPAPPKRGLAAVGGGNFQ